MKTIVTREKSKKTNQKGITLIALVVTIIVLLILAGISIQMLTGQNGILVRAGEGLLKLMMKMKNKRKKILQKIKIKLDS